MTFFKMPSKVMGNTLSYRVSCVECNGGKGQGILGQACLSHPVCRAGSAPSKDSEGTGAELLNEMIKKSVGLNFRGKD